MRYAVLFPGQGSQFVGMLAELARMFPVIQDTYDEASECLSYDLWRLVQYDPDDKLKQTEFTQVAVLVADVALWRCWHLHDLPTPYAFAGHSLGEYAALVAAHVLNFIEVVDLVALRSRLMQEAVPIGQGGMAAVLGLDKAQIVLICQTASKLNEPVNPANFNSKGQTVIAGQSAALNRAMIAAKEQGARYVKLLPVSVPSHCLLMYQASCQLSDRLKSLKFSKPQVPIYHNVDASCYQQPDEIRDALTRQLTNPVQWVDTIAALASNQVSGFIECGPGRVLQGLNKRITPDIPTFVTYMPHFLQTAVKMIKNSV